MEGEKTLEDKLLRMEHLQEDEVRIAGVTIKESEAKVIASLLKEMKFFNKTNAPKEHEQYDMLTRDYFQVKDKHITGVFRHPEAPILLYKRLLHNVHKLPELRALGLKNCYLQKIPSQVYDIPHLQELYLTGNAITILDSDLNKLQELRKLCLYNNKLNSIPKSVYGLPHLEYLHIGNNHITTLPQDVAYMKKLRILAMHENQLQINPHVLEELPALEELWIDKKFKVPVTKTNEQLHAAYQKTLQNLVIKGVAVKRM